MNPPDAKEFEFKFRIEPRDEPLPKGEDALVAFCREQIRALLDIVVLTHNGVPVDVDGFMWMREAYRPKTDQSQVTHQLYSPPNF
jgi:hypothetical protein